MSSVVTNINDHQILCADIRFSLPDVTNDQCWEIGMTQGQTPVLALATTYGLRASRMQLYPTFALDDKVVQDPGQFAAKPVIRFSSTNFITLAFSPFKGIDVEYNLWVPTSQLVVGEITCQNHTEKMSALEVTWRIQLNPLESGSPMKYTQIGLSSVLQGECADLFPVFYLPGEVYAARSAVAGLSAKYLLLPSATRQTTWALASLSTPNASFQQARQYSSKSLDVEKLRIEMADKNDYLRISTGKSEVDRALDQSRTRAFQLVMPALENFLSPTYISARGPDTGHHSRVDRLEISPEWSGQTLPGIWMMAQLLLPGQPRLVQGFLNNMLNRVSPEGKLDQRAGVNGSQTGYSSLPFLSQLVADLHPYLDDLTWLEEIHPRLLDFLKTWLKTEPDGSISVRGLAHPVQMGEKFSAPTDTIAASSTWMRWQEDNNILVTSLLIHEISSLLQISRWLDKKAEIEWLEDIKTRISSKLVGFWNENTGLFRHPQSTPEIPATGYLLHTYTRNGSFTPKRKLPVHGKIYLRITGEERLSSGFSCGINAWDGDEKITLHVKLTDMVAIGNTRVFVSDRVFSRVETLVIDNLPPGSALEIGQPDYEKLDLTQLLGLSCGVLTKKQADLLLRNIIVRDWLMEDQNSLPSAAWGESTYAVPAILVELIIEGLLRYEKSSLAQDIFRYFFTNRIISRLTNSASTGDFSGLNLEDLIPSRLFLRLRGIERLTRKEVILTHFIKQKRDAVTVQYNKVELKLKPYLAEIHSQSGEVIYLNRPGPNRILLE